MKVAAQRIRKIRRAKELSGTEIAERLGISAQYYYSIERGARTLSAEIAAQLAKIFGVSADYLLGLSDDEEGQNETREEGISFEEYDEFITSVKDIADKHGYDLTDPKFQELLHKALDFIESAQINAPKKGE